MMQTRQPQPRCHMSSSRAFSSKLSVHIPILIALGLSGSGCSVNIETTKVDEVVQRMPDEGIYYSLPKTAIDITFPAKLTITEDGLFAKKFELCKAACIGEPDNSKKAPEQCKYNRGASTNTTALSLALENPQITTKIVPDENHRYFIHTKSSLFQRVNHKVSLNEDGILTTADSAITDESFVLAADLTGKLIESVVSGMTFGLTAVVPDVEELDPEFTVSVTCGQVRGLETVLDKGAENIKALKKEKRDLITKDGLSARADTLKLVLDFLDNEIGAAKRAFEDAKALTQKNVKKTHELKWLTTVIPDEFSAFNGSSGIEWDMVSDMNLDWQDVTPNETIKNFSPQFNELRQEGFDSLLKQTSVNILVEVDSKEMPKPCSTSDNNCASDDDTAGYRYKIPVFGELKIKVFRKNKDDELVEWASNQMTLKVAQFGAIARLPSTFEAVGGEVSVSLYPDTGAGKVVGIGTTPLSTSSVSGVAGSVLSGLEKRRERKDAEREAELNAEKDRLTRQRDVLQLKKDIRDLNDALGIDQE